MKAIIVTLFLMVTWTIQAQNGNVSGLDAKHFHRYWKVESESPDYKVSFRGDTTEIVAPKGLTLWRKEKMKGIVTIEYDACVVVENEGDRLSDLNCFWMASDPKYPQNLWKREKWRSGIFLNCYSLQLYYVGFGGNHNKTTRFRRYDGNEVGVTEAQSRPSILKEYTDSAHLLKANHWYHIKITNEGGRVRYYIDGECLVDYLDATPLMEGWFGFRTTLSRTRITNFRYSMDTVKPATEAPLHWVGEVPSVDTPASFGVPFDQGVVAVDTPLQLTTSSGQELATDTWPLAYWPDGSIKWCGVASVIPASTESLILSKAPKGKKSELSTTLQVEQNESTIRIATGKVTAYLSRRGTYLIDSLVYNNQKVGEKARLMLRTQSAPFNENIEQVTFTNYTSEVKKVEIEQQGDVRATLRLEGMHRSAENREWLPFTVRLYFYAGSHEVKMVHSFIYDGNQDKDFIRALGVQMDVPLRERVYNRHVAFSCGEGGVWSEPVQPVTGRRTLSLEGYNKRDSKLQQEQMAGKRLPDYEDFNVKNQSLLDNWASWDGYRMSQLSADAYTIRKQATADSPWIGTHSGHRADGYAFVGDVSGGMGIALKDFWQSYPSALEVSNARSEKATLTAWLWSPEAEAMDLRHYDKVAHGLEASYEDVQDGMSTPYGIARTSTLTLLPHGGYAGKAAFAEDAKQLTATHVVMPTPQWLHDRRAFGIWSLPDNSTPFRSRVEERLKNYVDFYKVAIEQNKWYGFWNYGDVMHAYDPVRHQWRYDVGGFAWDNTELASNMWLWYNFLRTGDADLWRMSEAMTRHTGEVDVYHLGPHAGLGSRHNVTHWGCGAKEARISQAAWNRFYYYLTTDERCGDLMSEVTDSDQKLYTLDPMRLAQPRELYPCTAPARLRIGPDWLAYAGNWMTEWERTRNNRYRDKILAGMKSIVALPNRIFTGPLALGYDPATGVITSECDPKLESTNHLMTIMGGFEIMNEMIHMMNYPAWNDAWLDFATRYKQKSWELRKSTFRISRLHAYAAWKLRKPEMAQEAWNDLFTRLEHTPAPAFKMHTVMPPEVPAPLLECDPISTNDAAIWSLDAIFMQEVIPQ